MSNHNNNNHDNNNHLVDVENDGEYALDVSSSHRLGGGTLVNGGNLVIAARGEGSASIQQKQQHHQQQQKQHDLVAHSPHESKWQCVSPMTRHVIGDDSQRSSPPTARMRRRRSRSFNDYIESQQQQQQQQHQHHQHHNVDEQPPTFLHRQRGWKNSTSHTPRAQSESYSPPLTLPTLMESTNPSILHNTSLVDVNTTILPHSSYSKSSLTENLQQQRQQHFIPSSLVNAAAVTAAASTTTTSPHHHLYNKSNHYQNGNVQDNGCALNSINTTTNSSSIEDDNPQDNDNSDKAQYHVPKFQNNKHTHPQSSSPQSPTSSSPPPPTCLVNMLYGMINATIVIPVVMSFGNIIYQDPAFAPYTPVLIKLTLVSGMVHQLCFSSLSSLPFAVGSVQDAGLIFLSSMATQMVQYCHSIQQQQQQQQQQESLSLPSNTMDGMQEAAASDPLLSFLVVDDHVILATVTVGLGLAAATLGIGLMIIGKLKLAGYVQLLPTSVVAGYLAYIGWFCGKSGILLMAASVPRIPKEGVNTHMDMDYIYNVIWHVSPGLIGAMFVYASVRTFRHVAVLPSCIVILLLFFYMGLWWTGSSVEQATEHGWIRQAEPAPIWYHTWDYLRLDKVLWSAYPQLVLTEIGMLLVVALSSSLDVAAIELELKGSSTKTSEVKEASTATTTALTSTSTSTSTSLLDYNQELTMVGISNVISGMLGGYTGSYIFSQTIFSLRCGIQSRISGFVLALCEWIVIITPIPLLSYVPNFFYGSLLGMISIDLMYEWLYEFRFKSTTTTTTTAATTTTATTTNGLLAIASADYWIAIATFLCIQWLGVEYGILSGVMIHVLYQQIQKQINKQEQPQPQHHKDDNDKEYDQRNHHSGTTTTTTTTTIGTMETIPTETSRLLTRPQ